MNEIEALRSVNFDWAMRLSEVWDDSAWDVPDLHAEIRQEFAYKLDVMRGKQGGASPLGWVIVGGGGTGKTHLLGALRREAARRNAAFVLVDMTDVHDFWETVLQGYIDSLQQSVGEGSFQHECLLRNIIEQLGPNRPVGQILALLAERKSTDLPGDIQKVLHALGRVHRRETLLYHNAMRALICLNSEDPAIAGLGMTWLQGQALQETERARFGFTVAQEQPRKIIEALSWFLSLSGPTVLAFDQLDPIVTQLHYRQSGETSPEEESVAKSIIAQIGGGLGTLRDTTKNTLVLVSCVESTWEILQGTVLKTFVDRFDEPPWRLQFVGSGSAARSIIQGRLDHAFRSAGFTPPYESWPFRPEAFERLRLDSPREVLKKCEQHRKECLRAGAVRELTGFDDNVSPPLPPSPPLDRLKELDERCERLAAKTDPAHLCEEKQEDQRLAPLLQTALRCLLHETQLPDGVTGWVDSEFTGGMTTRPLHARLRLIFEKENEREEHFCIRALEQGHARAYQVRLKAAMVQSGIDQSLKFRRLCIVRTHPLPGGVETQRLTRQFTDSGGRFLKPSENELRTLNAVHLLSQSVDPDFEAWLRSRRPISRLSMIQSLVQHSLFDGQSTTTETTRGQGPDNGRPIEAATEPLLANPPQAPDTPPVASRETPFPLGRALIGNRVGDAVEMPVGLLEKHTLVLAGAGSGKTVLLRRLVEEAVLRDVPSIVIDCANDLATLDEPWPVPPESWGPGDTARASAYHRDREYVLWTPGREGGNPLSLEPIPDLSAFSHDDEELEAAVAMVRESLAPVVAPGQSAASTNKVGILSRTLRYFAQHGAGALEDFVALLNNLPNDAGLGVKNEFRLARQMADALKVAIETNPLLRSSGTPLDPAVLFGEPDSPRTRVSVISFAGLAGLEAQRAFLNQLAMTLFAWIKRHPEPAPRPLRGLLVLDEARDFAPSQAASTCKESLTRLTAQARKYHLGLVFATQNPKDIDNRIVSNCSTHYYGKVNSPAAIEAMRELIREKGGSGEDVPRLPRGQFYVHNADARMTGPARVQVPLCLSRHPANPLDEAAVLEKAVASRKRIQG